MIKKTLVFLLPVLAFAACTKCDEPGDVCTDEFRMITVRVASPAKVPVALDSSYTVRQSTGERIRPQQQMTSGFYIVLDDSYHGKLKKAEDNFQFVGWSNARVVVNETYRIAGDNCHISKRSGADSVTVQ